MGSGRLRGTRRARPGEPGGDGPLAIDRLLAVYLALSGALAAVAGGGVGLALAAGHLAAVLAVAALGRLPLPRGRWLRLARVAYPVALTPLLYAELATLNRFLFDGYFDVAVQGWEAAVFGLQLSLEASRWLPSTWLSELLHLGYLSYYLIVPAAVLGVFVTAGAGSAHRVAFAVALAFFASYVCFAAFPVVGPRYLFPLPDGPPAAGVFHDLVHAVLEAGSSKGTAFPSSHVAAAGAGVLAAGREDRRWTWLLAAPWVALTLGTVYGTFHYGVDAVAGILVAAAAWAVAPLLLPRLGRDLEG